MEPTIVWVAGQPRQPYREFVEMLQALVYHYARAFGVAA